MPGENDSAANFLMSAVLFMLEAGFGFRAVVLFRFVKALFAAILSVLPAQ